MYKVLIVDDEAPARELLKLKIDWASIDCQIIGTAKNGQEGLIFYSENKPDLVITDIQMPVMNGLQLIEGIKKINKQQPIIILSCHESFSFAKKAIQLGVDEYLIKDSFETEELYTIITNIFTNDAKKHPIPISQNNDQDFYQKSKAIIDLLSQQMKANEIAQHLKKNHLNLMGKSFIFMYLDIEIPNQNITDPNSHLLPITSVKDIYHIIHAELSTTVTGEVCYRRDNIYYAIYSPTSAHSDMNIRREAIQISNSIRHQINDNFHVQTNIGISLPFNDLGKMALARIQSKHAVERKIINGYDKSYIFNENNTSDDGQYSLILNVKLSRIREALKASDFKTVKKEVNSIFIQNLKGFMQYNYLKHTNWILLSMIIEFSSDNNLSFVDICDSPSPWETIMEMKTVDEMCNWFIKAIEKINTNLIKTEKMSYSFHVQKCIKYIDQHYRDTISLKELADDLSMNNAYLSRIFKKETGYSLTDYINKIRIDEAKNLLTNTNKKMYEIAELTGFSSNQRFFSIFKKVLGVSPGEFRKQ